MSKSTETAEEKLYNCPVEATISQIGGKYKAIILYHLLEDGVLRYNQIPEIYSKKPRRRCSASSSVKWKRTASFTEKCIL